MLSSMAGQAGCHDWTDLSVRHGQRRFKKSDMVLVVSWDIVDYHDVSINKQITLDYATNS
jgi:hypothetical protein